VPVSGPAPAAVPAVKAAVLPRPQPQEDEAPWGALTPETEKFGKRGDTSPTTGRSRDAVPRRRSSTTVPPAVSRQRLWWVVGIVAAVLVLVVVLLIVFAGGKKTEPSGDGSRSAIYVRPGGSVRDALDGASSGDVIVLQGEVAETVTLTGKKGITIQAEAGKMVIWRAPLNRPSPVSSLLTLQDAEGCHIKGIHFDGGGRAESDLTLYGRCPGLKLDDLNLYGYKQCGVRVFNCEGAADRPVLIAGLNFNTGKDAAAVSFEIDPKFTNGVTFNRYFAFRSCTFNGPGDRVKGSDKVRDGELPK
jgi:hypothetical protein